MRPIEKLVIADFAPHAVADFVHNAREADPIVGGALVDFGPILVVEGVADFAVLEALTVVVVDKLAFAILAVPW